MQEHKKLIPKSVEHMYTRAGCRLIINWQHRFLKQKDAESNEILLIYLNKENFGSPY